MPTNCAAVNLLVGFAVMFEAGEDLREGPAEACTTESWRNDQESSLDRRLALCGLHQWRSSSGWCM